MKKRRVRSTPAGKLRAAIRKRLVHRVCEKCGKDFDADKPKDQKRFCSHYCRVAAMSKYHSENLKKVRRESVARSKIPGAGH